MQARDVDVAIIGAGTAGLTAYRAALAAGARTVLIEAGAYGTTCARVGCMPSKLLIAAANAAHAMGAAAGFGVHVDGSVRIDGREVMARVRRERDRFVGFAVRDTQAIAEECRLLGRARFADDRTLIVDDHTKVTAKSIVIATGSRANCPSEYQALGDRLLVNDDLFDWHTLPAAVAVIGPGIIGLELGQALHRLGVRVVVLGRGGKIAALTDPKVLACALATFQSEFTLEPDAHITSLTREGARVRLQRDGTDGSPRTEYFDFVLAATGRVPNLAGLQLENTTCQLDAKGVPSFDPLTLQTRGKGAGNPIFIAGDADNDRPVLHEAADEGHIAGANAARLALGKPVEPGLRRAQLSVVFTEPQIAVVGGGFATAKPGRVLTGAVRFEDQGRARILLQNKGLLHVYADGNTGRLTGAELVAPGGEHLAHLLAWALQNQMTVAQMLDMPYYHPVLEEGLRTALRDLAAQLGTRRDGPGIA
ncbi:MAG: dihydrolipoyl dehydrogenase [Deltaproteobacteria bacterium]|nr:dihydrolipoyl dehydrogenase [Deltaproteobacteria bacterium]